MIEETGTIVELKGKHVAVVMCQKSSACQHCATAGACNLGDDSRSRLVDAHNPIGAGVGDRVRIVTSTRSFLQSSFVLYIVPIIALVIGAVAGKLVGEQFPLGLDPNVLSAIFGVFFLVGSFLVIRVGSQVLAAENYMPKITEIVPEEGL